jgi:hypothetical protein
MVTTSSRLGAAEADVDWKTTRPCVSGAIGANTQKGRCHDPFRVPAPARGQYGGNLMNDQVAKAMEVLFYGQCQLQSMIAANQDRDRKGLAQAYTEDSFADLAEQTRGEFRNAIEGFCPR